VTRAQRSRRVSGRDAGKRRVLDLAVRPSPKGVDGEVQEAGDVHRVGFVAQLAEVGEDGAELAHGVLARRPGLQVAERPVEPPRAVSPGPRRRERRGHPGGRGGGGQGEDAQGAGFSL